MDAKLAGRMMAAAQRSKLSSGLALATLVAMFAGFQWLVDNLNWKLRGSGVMIWLVFAFMVATGLIVATRMTSILQSDKRFVLGSQAAPRSRPAASLINLCSEVAQAVGYDGPYQTYIVRDAIPNAFAAGIGRGRLVAVHTGLLNVLDEDGIKGVLAHEFGHLKNNDIFMLVFVNGMILSFVIVGRMLFWLGRVLWGADEEKKDNEKKSSKSLPLGLACFLLGFVAMAIGYIFAPLASAFLSRRREEMADAFATANGFGGGLAKALEALGKSDMRTEPVNEAMAALYISEAKLNPVAALFGTHPTIASRLAKIGSMLRGDEGLVPDVLEGWIKSVIVFLAFTAGGWYLASKGLELPSLPFIGLPVAYVLSAVWLLVTYALFGMSSVKVDTKAKPKSIVVVAAFLMLAAIWVLGYGAIRTSEAIAGLSSLATIALWVWIAKPVAAFLGNWSGICGFLSDLASYASLAYAVVVLFKLFTTA